MCKQTVYPSGAKGTGIRFLISPVSTVLYRYVESQSLYFCFTSIWVTLCDLDWAGFGRDPPVSGCRGLGLGSTSSSTPRFLVDSELQGLVNDDNAAVKTNED